eukprot:scaffold197277_cov55-Attheya_sp.AAC.1
MIGRRGRKLSTAKERKDSKESKGTEFSDSRYTDFFEETVSEEYAKKLATQQYLLADRDDPSDVDVATMCRLYANFLNE